MKVLLIISRIIVGLVFVFSGVVKAIDPLGSAYKFHDYFMAFNIGFLDELSLFLAIFLCTVEFIAGFAVLTGMRQRTGILGVMLLMLIFTPLTLFLAIKNPVTDCGCFGDAIVLTNWQTFGKNIVILVFATVLFLNIKHFKNSLKTIYEWAIISVAIILLVLFSFYNLKYLPVIDFMPYSTGTRITDKMVVPEGVPVDEYQTTFIYEKDGVTKEFDLNNYPADDTTWKFIDARSILIKKGYQPPIHDFSITALNGDDATDNILSDKGFSVLMISTKISEADEMRLSAGFNLGKYCSANSIDFYLITASGSDEMRSFKSDLQYYTADETTLKTMIRANPGYMLISNGIIVGKWSWANVPDNEWFGQQLKQEMLKDLSSI